MEHIPQDVNEAVSPYVRRAMNHQPAKPFTLHSRVIFDYELLYMARGSLLVTIEDRTYEVKPGDMVLFKPGVEHSFQPASAGPFSMPHIHFDMLHYADYKKAYIPFKPYSHFTEGDKKLIRPDLLSGEPWHIPEFIRLYNHEMLLKIMLEIIKTHHSKDLFYWVKEKELVTKLIYTLATTLKIESDQSIRNNVGKLEEVRDYIAKNAGKKITLGDLSRMSCLSIFHLERLFKKQYGIPVLKYQQDRRMDMAIEHMLYSKMSLSGIAEKVGFSSIHSFSKAFKRMYGISPRHYVNNAHANARATEEKSIEKARSNK